MPPTIISTNDIISSVSKQHKQKGTAFNIQHSIMLLFPNKSKVTRNHLRQNKKAWELTCHSSHSLRPSHCPALLNEQRQYNDKSHATFKMIIKRA